MNTHVLLIRHGQPEGHESGYAQRMSGWTDTSLSSTGRQQIALLAESLRSKAAAPDTIYSSPLRRAAETATAISHALHTPVVHLDSLKEINCGQVDGRPVREVELRHPELWRANLRQDDQTFRWPGGESYCEFRDRCLGAVIEIAARHDGKRVAIVTHAGVISQILGYLHEMSPAKWEPFRPGPASITELQWRGRWGKVLRFDDRAHLSA